MKNTNKKITAGRDVFADQQELAVALEQLCGEAERIIDRKSAGVHEADFLARRVTDIRCMLQALNRSPQGPASAVVARRIGAELTGLIGRYLDLEGKVKELRNDLDRRVLQEQEGM